MKWVVITLALVNGLYLVTQLNQEEPSQSYAANKTDFPYKVPQLVLFAEKEKLDRAKQFAEKQKQKKLAKQDTKKTAAPVRQEKTVVTKAEASKLIAAPAPEPRSAPPPKPKSPPPVVKPAPVVKSVPPPLSPQPLSTSSAMACYSVGPFLLMSDIKAVSQLFELADINTQERAEALRKQVGYWVYVPPMASLQEARVALRQMKDNDVDDALIISEGSKANAISLGVFKTEELGMVRKNSITKLGYQSKVEPLFRTQPQYWLDMELAKSTRVPDKLWREVVAGYPNIKQLRRKCE